MKTSWNETELIENRLKGFGDTGDALLFDAMLILDGDLTEKVQWQQKTYAVIDAYSRKQVRKEIEAAHQKLFSQPAYHNFSQRIRRFFINK